jgi:hypothetical protein
MYFFDTPLSLFFIVPFVSNWYFPPFIFLQVLKNCPNSNSSSQIWKARIVFSIFVCWWVFCNYPCFWEMVVNNLFVCSV